MAEKVQEIYDWLWGQSVDWSIRNHILIGSVEYMSFVESIKYLNSICSDDEN